MTTASRRHEHKWNGEWILLKGVLLMNRCERHTYIWLIAPAKTKTWRSLAFRNVVHCAFQSQKSLYPCDEVVTQKLLTNFMMPRYGRCQSWRVFAFMQIKTNHSIRNRLKKPKKKIKEKIQKKKKSATWATKNNTKSKESEMVVTRVKMKWLTMIIIDYLFNHV